MIKWERMKVALVGLNVSYIHKNLALRWLMVTKPSDIDAQIFEQSTKQVDLMVKNLIDYQPDWIGISVYIFNLEATIRLIHLIKENLVDCKIVVGGPEATYNPKVLFDTPIDGIIRGEGEFAFWDIVLGKKSPFYQTRLDEQIPLSKVTLADLESYESPYFLSSDQEDMNKRYLYVESGRGCPYGCTYCMASLDQSVRFFSDSYMQSFFSQLKDSKVQQVKFLDRTFNVNSKRAYALALQCMNMPESLHFHVELVGDTLDEALIKLLIDQGQERFRLEIGVQSFNQECLNQVSRISHLHRLREVILRFSQAKMKQHLDLIAGLPLMDMGIFIEDYNQLMRNQPYEAQIGILKILKGSNLEINHSQAYQYQTKPPYQIIKSQWMSETDIKDVEAIALATDKLYNSQRIKEGLDQLFIGVEPYPIMLKIGQDLLDLSHPYSTQQFYRCILASLSAMIESDHAYRLIAYHYYQEAKMIPSSLIDRLNIDALPYRPMLNQMTQLKHYVIVPSYDLCALHDIWIYDKFALAHHMLRFDFNGKCIKEEHYETPLSNA